MTQQTVSQLSETTLQTLTDRTDVVDTFYRLMLYVDTRNWDGLREVLADEVRADYTDLWGGEAKPQTAQSLIEAWRGALSGFKATQHLLGNPIVELEDDRASLTVSVQAQHFLPNDRGSSLWTLGGGYLVTLARAQGGWRVREMTLKVGWTDGNLYLFDLARQGAASGSKGGEDDEPTPHYPPNARGCERGFRPQILSPRGPERPPQGRSQPPRSGSLQERWSYPSWAPLPPAHHIRGGAHPGHCDVRALQ
jgi:hypothetical protein